MPSKDLDVKTIAAAAAGLCLAAGAASFLTSGDQPAGIVLAPAASLIVIEDEVEMSIAAAVDAVDPDMFAASMGILIEDDNEPVIAEASGRLMVEEDDGRAFFRSLAASVALIEVDTDVPEGASVPVASTPRVNRHVSPAHRDSVASSDDEALATLDSAPANAAAGVAPVTAISGFHRAELRPVRALTPDEIQTSIARQLPMVRQCYERELKSDSTLSGRMVLKMSVQPSGSVTGAGVKDDEIGSDELASCVTRAVGKFTFPQGTESVAVEYPVTLKASRW